MNCKGILYNKITGDILRNYRKIAHLKPEDFGDPNVDVIHDQIVENYMMFRVDLEKWAEGIFVLQEKDTQENLETTRKRAKMKLARMVSNARATFLSRDQLQIQDYQEKAKEAQAFKNDQNTNPEDYPLLGAEIGFHGTANMNDVANLVLEKASEARKKLGEINQLKLTALGAINTSVDRERIMKIPSELTLEFAVAGNV